MSGLRILLKYSLAVSDCSSLSISIFKEYRAGVVRTGTFYTRKMAQYEEKPKAGD